jgi:hypothetical protein
MVIICARLHELEDYEPDSSRTPFSTRESAQRRPIVQQKESLSRAFRADARTRTGDPFITSDAPVSARVRPSHAGPLVMGDPADWSGLGVTGEDNLVDGWWTARRLSD